MPITSAALDSKSATRSLEVRIENKTDRDLKFEHSSAEPGTFLTPPPDTIKAGDSKSFFLASNNEVQGRDAKYRVVYAINGFGPHGLLLVGENPWSLGHVSASTTVSPEASAKGIRAKTDVNQGNVGLVLVGISENT